jgi:hypothetical protein
MLDRIHVFDHHLNKDKQVKKLINGASKPDITLQSQCTCSPSSAERQDDMSGRLPGHPRRREQDPASVRCLLDCAAPRPSSM